MQRPTIEELNALIDANPGKRIIVTIPEEFITSSNEYYQSVSVQFKKSLNKKKWLSVIAFFLTLGLISLGVLVFYLTLKYLPIYKQYIPIDVNLYAILVIFTIIFIFTLFDKDFISIKLKQYFYSGLSNEAIRFCYLQIVYDNLKNYLRNDQKVHLKIAYDNLEKYLSEENLYLNMGI